MILTTQHMEEADRLCNRVGIVDHGRLVAEGAPDALRAATGEQVITIETAGPGDAERVALLTREVSGLGPPVVTGTTVSAPAPRTLSPVAVLLARLEEVKVAFTDVRVGPPSLEDVYLHHTGTATRDATPEHAATAISVAMGASGAQR